jgi:anti-anti-sigma factor
MIEIAEHDQGIFIVKIKMSEIHTLYVPDLKEKLQRVIKDNNIKKLVLDLSEVSMITSSGIGIFLNIYQDLKTGLRLACPNIEVQKVLDLTKVTSLIKIFKTLEEAIQSF